MSKSICLKSQRSSLFLVLPRYGVIN